VAHSSEVQNLREDTELKYTNAFMIVFCVLVIMQSFIVSFSSAMKASTPASTASAQDALRDFRAVEQGMKLYMQLLTYRVAVSN